VVLPTAFDPAPVSILYVPGHKARALEKARDLPADMIIIDLEDAVPTAEKAAARQGATNAMAIGFAGKLVAIRINISDTEFHAADCALITQLRPDAVVLPKVESAQSLDALALPADIPVIAMIESPAAIYAAPSIAAHHRVIALLAGLNDLAHDLQLPDGRDRSAMMLAIQSIVLAARANGVLAFDGVYNAIDDAPGFAAEAADGHRLGFDGKSLIHPSQIDPCNNAFAPSEAALTDALALLAAAISGAERFNGRMVEDMHVDTARSLIRREELRAARRAGAQS
jgi:citrate lyase subunit beta/citryl-CoA lyase